MELVKSILHLFFFFEGVGEIVEEGNVGA